MVLTIESDVGLFSFNNFKKLVYAVQIASSQSSEVTGRLKPLFQSSSDPWVGKTKEHSGKKSVSLNFFQTIFNPLYTLTHY